MSAIDSTAVTGEMVPASPANAGAGSTRTIALGLVAFALLLWGASVGVFLTHSLDELPLYLPNAIWCSTRPRSCSCW